MGDRRKQDLGKVDQYRHACGKKWQIRGGGKTSGRWVHHPTQAHMWETMDHKRRQGETRPREDERSTHKGKQRVKERQDLVKADTPYDGRQTEARPQEGGHSIQRRHTCGKTRRQGQTRPREGGAHRPTQGKTRRREGGRASQHRHSYGETMGNNGSQWETNRDKTSGRPTHHPRQAYMRGDNGRQDRGKVDTASNGHTCGVTMGDKNRQTMRDNGRQGETRPREGGHTINTGTHLGRQWETRGNEISGRRTHHPTGHCK